LGVGALLAAVGGARTHTLRDFVASILAELDRVMRAVLLLVDWVLVGVAL
jgi:hypothetical protein